MSPAAAMEGLRAFSRFETVMAVGHEPDLSALAAELLGLPNPGALHFLKATLLGIEIDSLREGQGCLEFMVPSKLT
jgi:phosphohistidine phosphatase SixA